VGFDHPAELEPAHQRQQRVDEDDVGEAKVELAQPRERVVGFDDLDTLALTRLLLPEKSFEVVEAYDAFAGMREFYFRFPDIVLVDALLPLMSGLELCRVIKSHPELGSIPVVILSAAAQEEEIRSGYRVGADAYLVKPFRPQDLLDTVHRLTNRRTD